MKKTQADQQKNDISASLENFLCKKKPSLISLFSSDYFECSADFVSLFLQKFPIEGKSLFLVFSKRSDCKNLCTDIFLRKKAIRLDSTVENNDLLVCNNDFLSDAIFFNSSIFWDQIADFQKSYSNVFLVFSYSLQWDVYHRLYDGSDCVLAFCSKTTKRHWLYKFFSAIPSNGEKLMGIVWND